MSSLPTLFIFMRSSILRIHCSTFSLYIAQKRRVLLHTPSIKPIRQGLGQNYNIKKTTTKDNTKRMHSMRKRQKHLSSTITHNNKQYSHQSQNTQTTPRVRSYVQDIRSHHTTRILFIYLHLKGGGLILSFILLS